MPLCENQKKYSEKELEEITAATDSSIRPRWLKGCGEAGSCTFVGSENLCRHNPRSQETSSEKKA